MFWFFLFIFLIFLCYGSFLNVVAYRTITDKPFFQKRSSCNSCNKIIAWFDNIPVISWFVLKGKCRNCKTSISLLYPFIELLTAVLMTALFYKNFYFDSILIFSSSTIYYFFALFIFFTALIVATRTDLQAMIIPQIFSLWLIPVALIFSYFNFLNISLRESIFGALLGYFSLWITAKLFKLITKKEGLGVGDMELLGMIGSFIGPFGVWFSLMIGSVSGLLFGGIFLWLTKKGKETRIPFGPFLALGSVIYYFFADKLF